MIAYLEGGKRMDYRQYLQSDEWKEKRRQREIFDNFTCALCHRKITTPICHHMSYERLGHENIVEDIITLCWACHERFHSNWGKMSEIDSRLVPNHWKYFSSEATLKFFIEHIKDDYLLGGTYNMCKSDVINGFIDEFYINHDPARIGIISASDVKYFFVNRRLEHLINCVLYEGMDYEDFLNTYYGEKGKAGHPNTLRVEANKAFKDMAANNCKKAIYTLRSPQGKYIENLWDFYQMEQYRKKIKEQSKED